MRTKPFSNPRILFTFLAIFISFAFVGDTFAQKRDNLTDKEDLMIREAQELDLRIKVLSKVIDRRLESLGDIQIVETKKKKTDDGGDWGDLRTGTFGELFWDINKTLDDAISRIDDVAERDMKNPLFGKSLKILASNCRKWNPKFETFADKAKDEKDKGLVLSSIENCTQIIDGSARFSKDSKDD